MVERDSRKLVVEGIIYQISFLNLTVLLNQLSKVTSLNLRLKSCYQVMQIYCISEKPIVHPAVSVFSFCTQKLIGCANGEALNLS